MNIMPSFWTRIMSYFYSYVLPLISHSPLVILTDEFQFIFWFICQFSCDLRI